MTNIVVLGFRTRTFITLGLGGGAVFVPFKTATAELCVTTKLDSELCK